MNLNEYQKEALRTALKEDFNKELVVSVLGLAGESGELIDHIKKYYGHGHKLDKEYLKKELGDILWYVAYMADTLDISLEEIALENINKLKKRYPNGFNSHDSLNRNE